jgi:hypothetical protein
MRGGAPLAGYRYAVAITHACLHHFDAVDATAPMVPSLAEAIMIIYPYEAATKSQYFTKSY